MIRYADAIRSQPKRRPADKVIVGLKEAIAHAQGRNTGARLHAARKSHSETVIPVTRKRGRPVKPDADKPWVVAGLSRSTWFRKQKAKA